MLSNTFKTALLLSGVALLLTTCAFAQAGGGSAPPEIQTAYQQMDTVMDQRNPDALLKFYTWNATFFNSKGAAFSRAQLADSIRKTIRSTQSLNSATTIDNALVAKDGVTVTVHQKISGTNIDPKTGILNTVLTSITERDHWIQIGSTWKINRSRTLSAFSMVNGKVVPTDM